MTLGTGKESMKNCALAIKRFFLEVTRVAEMITFQWCVSMHIFTEECALEERRARNFSDYQECLRCRIC